MNKFSCAGRPCRAIVKTSSLVCATMRMQRINSALRGGALGTVAGLLSACGYLGGSHPARVAHAPPPPPVTAPSDPEAKVLAGMVDAVGPSRSHPPVNLKFSIHDRPQAGQDDEIDYALVPEVPGIETLHLVFASLSGLQVVSHGPALAAIKPASSVPIFGSVTVRPAKPGLFTLTAAVAVQFPDRSVVWPFTIPVIVGEGPAQTAANQP
jgi:hypothetical protein